MEWCESVEANAIGPNMKVLLSKSSVTHHKLEECEKFTFEVKQFYPEVFVKVKNYRTAMPKTAVIEQLTNEFGNKPSVPIVYSAGGSYNGRTDVIENMPIGKYQVGVVATQQDKDKYDITINTQLYNDPDVLLPPPVLSAVSCYSVNIESPKIFAWSVETLCEYKKSSDTKWKQIPKRGYYNAAVLDPDSKYCFRYYLRDSRDKTRVQKSEETLDWGPMPIMHRFLRSLIKFNETDEYIKDKKFAFWIHHTVRYSILSVSICEKDGAWRNVECSSRKEDERSTWAIVSPVHELDVQNSFHVRLYLNDSLVFQTVEPMDFRWDASFTSQLVKKNNSLVTFSYNIENANDNVQLKLSRYKTFHLSYRKFRYYDNWEGFEEESNESREWYGTYSIEPLFGDRSRGLYSLHLVFTEDNSKLTCPIIKSGSKYSINIQIPNLTVTVSCSNLIEVNVPSLFTRYTHEHSDIDIVSKL
jgi:hypothetical protein